MSSCRPLVVRPGGVRAHPGGAASLAAGGAGGARVLGGTRQLRPFLGDGGEDLEDHEDEGTRCASCDRPRHLTDGLCRECSPDRCPGLNRDGSRCRVLGPFCPRHGRR